MELWSLNGARGWPLPPSCSRVRVRYVRYVRYTSLALGLSAFWGWAPLFFVFCFPLPPTTPDPPGPCTDREIKKAPPGHDWRRRGGGRRARCSSRRPTKAPHSPFHVASQKPFWH